MKIEIALTRGCINPSSDDGPVSVTCEIRLPIKKETGYLADELIFEKRIELLGENLYNTWGLLNRVGGYRYWYFSVGANTFKEASELAIEKAKKALEPLKQALEERQRKIKKFGKFQPKKLTIQI